MVCATQVYIRGSGAVRCVFGHFISSSGLCCAVLCCVLLMRLHSTTAWTMLTESLVMDDGSAALRPRRRTPAKGDLHEPSMSQGTRRKVSTIMTRRHGNFMEQKVARFCASFRGKVVADENNLCKRTRTTHTWLPCLGWLTRGLGHTGKGRPLVEPTTQIWLLSPHFWGAQ